MTILACGRGPKPEIPGEIRDPLPYRGGGGVGNVTPSQARERKSAIRCGTGAAVASSQDSSATAEVQGPYVQMRMARVAASRLSRLSTLLRIDPVKGV